jgi:hypothetical protein
MPLIAAVGASWPCDRNHTAIRADVDAARQPGVRTVTQPSAFEPGKQVGRHSCPFRLVEDLME